MTASDGAGSAAGSRDRPPTLDDPVAIAGMRLRNRLYRAPLLECAGTGDDAVDRLTDDDAVAAGERLADAGFDAVVPVRTSVFWDMSVVRGEFPTSAWRDPELRDGFRAAFESLPRAAAVAVGNWVESLAYGREPGWNRDLCRRVRNRIDAPVLCEGGLRERSQLDDALARDADLVGVARPVYPEPELPTRLLGERVDPGVRAVCADCNNCAVAQAAGESGVCRTPSVLRTAGELRRHGAYDRPDAAESSDGDDP